MDNHHILFSGQPENTISIYHPNNVIYTSIFIYIYLYLSMYLSIYLSVHIYIYICIDTIYLSIYLPIYLSIYQFVYIYIYIYTYSYCITIFLQDWGGFSDITSVTEKVSTIREQKQINELNPNECHTIASKTTYFNNIDAKKNMA